MDEPVNDVRRRRARQIDEKVPAFGSQLRQLPQLRGCVVQTSGDVPNVEAPPLHLLPERIRRDRGPERLSRVRDQLIAQRLDPAGAGRELIRENVETVHALTVGPNGATHPAYG